MAMAMAMAMIPPRGLEFQILLFAQVQYLQMWILVQVMVFVASMLFLLNLEEPTLTDLLHSRKFGCLLYLLV